MRPSRAAALIGAAGLTAVFAVPTPAEAWSGSFTVDLYCIDTSAGYTFVPITDTGTSTQRQGGWTNETDTLTDPATGVTATFRSKYKRFSDESSSWWSGPAILDNGEISGGIYYLTGHATLSFSAGGYTGSFSANKVVNVCATTFGYAS